MAIVFSAEGFMYNSIERFLKEVCGIQVDSNKIYQSLVKPDRPLDSLDTKTQYTNNFLTDKLHNIGYNEGEIDLKTFLKSIRRFADHQLVFVKGNDVAKHFLNILPNALIFDLNKIDCPKPEEIYVEEEEIYSCSLSQHNIDSQHCATVNCMKLGFWLKKNANRFYCNDTCMCASSWNNGGRWCLEKLKFARVHACNCSRRESMNYRYR